MSSVIYDKFVFDHPLPLLAQLKNGQVVVNSIGHDEAKHTTNIINNSNWKNVTKYFVLQKQGLDWPPKEFNKVYKTLGVEKSVPWNWVIHPTKYKQFILNLSKELLVNCDVDYISIFDKGNSLLKHTKPIKINQKELLEIDEKPSLLETFATNKEGLTTRCQYDRMSSVTGRLVTSSGPQIGLIKKENRKIIKSRFDGGKIICLDFKSIEPRTIAYRNGFKELASQRDIYTWFVANCLQNKITRTESKEIILKRIYGAGEETILNGFTGNKRDFEFVLNQVDEYFGFYSFSHLLLKEAKNNGTITTMFGGKLDVSEVKQHVLINYWAQRSAVDLGLWLSSRLIELLSQDVLFIGNVVDAFVFDVNKHRCDSFVAEATAMLENPAVEIGVDTPFYIEVSYW